jgi:Zn-dependent protease
MSRKISFSRTELEHLVRAWFAITLAFAIAMSGGKFFEISFLIKFIISAITVGLGFVAHEIAHKIVAQKHKCFAEFRANDMMLVLAVVISFTGVILAAPGAVMIAGNVTRKIHGKIAASGPAMNIILAVLFLGLYFVSGGLLKQVGFYGMMINSWLAMFNILPFPMFDGLKIMQWDKFIYGIMAAIAAALLFLSGVI